ncbi:MAG: HNH endonuclease [Candidatus Heimdallarchaeaceae archaeon]
MSYKTNKDIIELLKIAEVICKDINFPLEVAIKEFVYELENRRIDFLRPKITDLNTWTIEKNGKLLFKIHLEKKTRRPWDNREVFKFWEIYTIEMSKSKRKSLREEIIFQSTLKGNKFFCSHCKKQIKRSEIEIDHLVPIAKGGNSKKENFQILCKKCNQRKKDKYWIILHDKFKRK